ncbi:MAG: aldo/keto reductase [Acholeplasmataceae bacterium]|nr:aldo/keto reductase [Acholeplasmataceae bacterium]
MKDKNKDNHQMSRLGFGGWQLGNADFWGEMSLSEGVDLVKEAIKEGIRFFDTAPGYANGMSETIIGLATHDVRQSVIINTKFGHTADGKTDFRVASIRRDIKESLGRLQTDYLDSILLHNPSHEILKGETKHFDELNTLKKEGLIRAYGVSIDTYDELEMVLDHLCVDTVEILFNIFFQKPAGLFKRAHEQGITLIVKVPLDSGWLTGKYDQHSTFAGIRSRWTKEVIERRASLVQDLKILTGEDALTKFAIGFILSHHEVDYVIPGIKNKKQLFDHVKNVQSHLSLDLKKAFIRLYEEKIVANPLPW